MFLKPDIDLEDFFHEVRQCKGQVTFQSTEGDLLNLKSSLCLFLFTTAYTSGQESALTGSIIFQYPEEGNALRRFFI